MQFRSFIFHGKLFIVCHINHLYCWSLTFIDLVAPKGAVFKKEVKKTVFTHRIFGRTSVAAADPLSSCCPSPGCIVGVVVYR